VYRVVVFYSILFYRTFAGFLLLFVSFYFLVYFYFSCIIFIFNGDELGHFLPFFFDAFYFLFHDISRLWLFGSFPVVILIILIGNVKNTEPFNMLNLWIIFLQIFVHIYVYLLLIKLKTLYILTQKVIFTYLIF
jgi:hypothetical protein